MEAKSAELLEDVLYWHWGFQINDQLEVPNYGGQNNGSAQKVWQMQSCLAGATRR